MVLARSIRDPCYYATYYITHEHNVQTRLACLRRHAGLKLSFQYSSTFPNYCNLNGGGDVSGNSLSGHRSKPSSQMPRLCSFFSERNNFSFTALAIRMLTKCKLCIMFLFWIICGVLWSTSGWAKQFHQKQVSRTRSAHFV